MKEFSKYETFYIYDEPIEYKGIKLFPILMREYLPFFYFSECFTLDKNSINDVKIISMTYFEYMITSSTEEKPYVWFFDAIMKMSTRDKNLEVKYGKNKKGKFFFKIGEIEYSASDFEEIKKIICEYNSVDLPDEKIQKEIRDNMEKAKELRNRNSGKMASLEDQLVCVLISTNLSLSEIYDLPIRKFIRILERADLKLHYQIYLGASMSGLVEFKDKSFIKHWMSDLNKEKLDLVPFEQVKDSISGNSAKSKIRKKKNK